MPWGLVSAPGYRGDSRLKLAGGMISTLAGGRVTDGTGAAAGPQAQTSIRRLMLLSAVRHDHCQQQGNDEGRQHKPHLQCVLAGLGPDLVV